MSRSVDIDKLSHRLNSLKKSLSSATGIYSQSSGAINSQLSMLQHELTSSRRRFLKVRDTLSVEIDHCLDELRRLSSDE
jgi:hypothetical protein